MPARKVRYMVDDAAPFALHGEGLTIQAVTRKSEVPVTVEVEGLSRRMLVQLRRAIDEEVERREERWKQQHELVLRRGREEEAGPSKTPEQPAA